jgi:hypothetical protein
LANSPSGGRVWRGMVRCRFLVVQWSLLQGVGPPWSTQVITALQAFHVSWSHRRDAYCSRRRPRCRDPRCKASATGTAQVRLPAERCCHLFGIQGAAAIRLEDPHLGDQERVAILGRPKRTAANSVGHVQSCCLADRLRSLAVRENGCHLVTPRGACPRRSCCDPRPSQRTPAPRCVISIGMSASGLRSSAIQRTAAATTVSCRW